MFVKPPQKPIAIDPTRIFIAHSNNDAKLALSLRDQLEGLDFAALRAAAGIEFGNPDDQFEVWTYEYNMAFGDDLSEIKEQIRDCDIFIIILSHAAVQSDWTQRELGLAISLRETNEIDYPRLIAVLASNDTPLSIPLRDFDSGRETGRHIDFALQRCFSIESRHTDFFSELAYWLTIRTRVFGTNAEDSDDIPDDAFRCYEALFPIVQERDDPIDIREWIKKAYLYGSDGNQWVELFFTVQVGHACIGMAYITLHPQMGWIFGNYFGIRSEWRRRKLLAVRVLRVIAEHSQGVAPRARGIVFEAEPYDNAILIRILKKLSRGQTRLSEKEKYQVRAVRRIAQYTENGLASRNQKRRVALAVATSNFQPIFYFQPAQRAPLGPVNEVILWLMIYPFKGLDVRRHDGLVMHEIDIEQILGFLYDGMYKYAYAGSSSTAIVGFDNYMEDVKRRVREVLGTRSVYLTDRTMLSREARMLLTAFARQLRELEV